MHMNMTMSSGAYLKTAMAPAARVLWRALPGVAAATLLAACNSIVPGMRMDTPPTLPTGETTPAGAGGAGGTNAAAQGQEQIPVTEITLKLIRDMNVSLHAIPGEGLGLDWHYFKRDGSEVEGSTTDAKSMRDTARVPEGRFNVRMLMTPLKNGDVNLEAWVNGHRFAHVVLPDFGGTVGKVAVGCRNLSCRFDNLTVRGTEVARPAARE